MNSEASISRVLAQVDERALGHVTLACFDTTGLLRSKRFRVDKLRSALSDGVPLGPALLAIDPAGKYLIEDNPLVGQFRDGVLALDAESCRTLPFGGEHNGLLILGNFTAEAAAFCPRALLRGELERLDALGFTIWSGFELECSVLDTTPEALRDTPPDAITLRPGTQRYLSFADQTLNEALFDDIARTCESMAIPVDTLHLEYVDQLEAGLGPRPGVHGADDAALYKAVAKVVGRKHGSLMSFMALRNNQAALGCGAHPNVSLRDRRTDEPVFFDAAAPDHLSATMRHFLGGLYAHIPELFLLLAPYVNSFKRFQPGLIAPLHNTWGLNNKSVAFRAINASPASARIEVRVPGADINPHLALAAVMAAGRIGLEQKLEPPAPIEGDGWNPEEIPEPNFPRSFAEAIERFERSALARDAFGDAFVELFAADRRWQIEQLERTVTDWELRTFAEGV